MVMKKIFAIFFAASLAVFSLAAQDTEKQYLPKEGNWSVGFDVKPMLQLVESILSEQSDDIATDFNGLGGEPTLLNGPTVSIMGKYMLTDNFALKANVGILVDNNKVAGYVTDDEASVLNPLADAKVADYKNTRSTGISLMAGAEYRIGKKRVQGVFGGGVLVGIEKAVSTYHYGNAMTVINQTPSVYNKLGKVYNENNYRTLKQFGNNPNYLFGLVGTAGVEFFVAPMVALGAEVSLLASYTVYQQTYIISEGYNTSTRQIEQRTDLVTPMYGSFKLATENLGANLYMSFYF